MRIKSIVASVILGILFSQAGFAQQNELKVKVTSFVFTDGRNRVAELCGKVEAATPGQAYWVKVVIDPRSKNPGSYHSLAEGDGRFCMIVATYEGEANASARQLTGSGSFGKETSALVTASSR